VSEKEKFDVTGGIIVADDVMVLLAIATTSIAIGNLFGKEIGKFLKIWS